MERAYLLVRNAEFLDLMFTAGLVFYIGRVASVRYPKVLRIGAWLGGLVFLAYIGMGITLDGYDPLGRVAGYVLYGGLGAGLVMGASRFIAAFAIWTWQLIVSLPRHYRDKWTHDRRRNEEAVRYRQEALDRQSREQQARRHREVTDRRAQQYQLAQEETARLQAAERRRRTQARADCELCYSQHVNEISARIPKSMLDAFLDKYMADNQPADEVENRGQQLQRIIEGHSHAVKPPKKFKSMQELTEWFLNEKQHIEALPIDTDVRDLHLVQLNMSYAELTQDLLQMRES